MRAELRWLPGQPDLALAEVRSAYDRALGHVDPWAVGALAIWLARLPASRDLPPDLPEPYALELAGDWRAAAAAWERPRPAV